MFTDNSPSLSISEGEVDHVLDQLTADIASPNIRAMTTGLVESSRETSQGLNDLLTEPDYLSIEPNLSQSTVDKFVSQIIGEEALDSAKSHAKVFCDGTTKILRDGKFEDTLLRASLQLGSMAEQETRKVRRKVSGLVDKFEKKARALVEYIDHTPHEISNEQLVEIGIGSVYPIDSVISRVRADRLDKTEKDADRKLAILSEVDMSTDFNTLKMLLFANIADMYKRPSIIQAYKKVFEGSDAQPLIDINHLGPFAFAAYLIEEPDAGRVELASLASAHAKLRRRQFGIPSKEFKRDIHRLNLLFSAYSKIEATEDGVTKVEEATQKLTSFKQENTKVAAISLALTGAENIGNFLIGLMETNEFQNQYDDDSVWQDILKAEKIANSIASALRVQIQNPLFGFKNGEKQVFDMLSQPRLDEEKRSHLVALKKEQQKPTIDSLTEEYLAIDEPYKISNKKLRERCSNLFTNAKRLSELFNPHEPLDDDLARRLIGLMSGIYWERTGKGQSEAELAETYVNDTRRLREIGSKLDQLNSSQNSKLLAVINLLDEIIDSGFFDNINSYEEPQLASYLGFVKAYNRARGYESVKDEAEQPQSEAEPVELNLDEKEEEIAIPIETLGQATEEDLLVFPPSATAEEIIRDYKDRVPTEDLPFIEWERIVKIIELRDQLAKQSLDVNFIRSKHASWQVLPFFILEVSLPGSEHSVAVIESPVYGNATYVYREGGDRFEWREVVQLGRKDARELGAVAAVHVDSAKLDVHIRKIWNRVISELTINS